jgi:hypothetical protein
MKKRNSILSNFVKKKNNNTFMLVLAFIISLFTSISLNISGIYSIIGNVNYVDFPDGYSAYSNIDKEKFRKFMDTNFTGLEYTYYYCAPDSGTINIQSKDLTLSVFGCQENFENFPVPSPFSDSIVNAQLLEGSSFDETDIIMKSNAMIMYSSHLEKIGYGENNALMLNGQKLVLKGVLKDNNEIKRHIRDNVIQIFIPYTTFNSLFRNTNVKTIIHTGDFTFSNFENNGNFISKYKVLKLIENYKIFINATSLPAIVAIYIISFIATVIVQIILINSRHNEIGIRRAVGASKDSIIFLFTTNSLLVILKGILLGLCAFLISFFSVELILSNMYVVNLFVLDISVTLISIFSYFILNFFCVLIPTIIGSSINISSILVEER